MTDDDALETPRVWVGCLGCYNAGRLHGAWVDAIEASEFNPHKDLCDACGARLTDRDKVELALDVGFVPHGDPGHYIAVRNPEMHEEWWVMDFEGFNGFLKGECSPSEAQSIAEKMAEIPDHIPRPAVAAYLENTGDSLDEFDLSDFEDKFCGEWSSEKDYAQEYAEEVGAVNPDIGWPYSSIDWDQAADELMMDYWTAKAPGGNVYIFHD